MAKKATKSGSDALSNLMALAGTKPKPGKTAIPFTEVDKEEAAAIRNWYQGKRLADLAAAMLANAEETLAQVAEPFRREQCLSTRSIINSVKLNGETNEVPPIVSLHVTPRIAEIIRANLAGNSEPDAVEAVHQIQTETKPYEGEVRVTQTLRFTNMKPECIPDLKKEFNDDFDTYFNVSNFIKINASKLNEKQREELANVISSALKQNKLAPEEFMTAEVKVETTEKFQTDVMTDRDVMSTWNNLVQRTGYCTLQKAGFHPSGVKE